MKPIDQVPQSGAPEFYEGSAGPELPERFTGMVNGERYLIGYKLNPNWPYWRPQ